MGRELWLALCKFSPSEEQANRDLLSVQRAARTILFVNRSKATASLANSIIPSARAGSTPTMRGQTTIIATAQESQMLAGRLTRLRLGRAPPRRANSYGSEACLSIASATREIQTQSLIPNRLTIF